MNLMKVVNAVNTYINAIPIRIIIVELAFLNDDTRMIAAAGISENTKAFTICPALPAANGMMHIPKTM